jgi:hypothetical protein
MKNAGGRLLWVSLCWWSAWGASGQVEPGDIALGSQAGRLAVGDGSRDPSGGLVFEECVFGVGLDALARSVNPGFDSDTGAFPANATIGYAYRSALRRWDGVGFSQIPAERVRMSFGPLAGISTPTSDPAQPVEGVFLGVASNGEFHNHYTFRLELNGTPATGPSSLGLYLLELEMRARTAPLGPSEPFWLVLNNGADSAEFQRAVDVARSTLSGCASHPVCRADVNGDGVVSPTDFSAWVSAFNQSSPACDQNGDGMCSATDFSAWVGNFNNGC